MYLNRQITAQALESWAKTRESEACLPRLLRLLIHASNAGITRYRFPSDESVSSGGWDGLVDATRGDPYIPAGTSVWELSTRRGTKAKADEDFAKRADDPRGVVPSETTFVFVTPRRWSRKHAWEGQRNDQGAWKDVRVYDADDLAAWLEQAPAVSAWMLRLLGIRPAGVTDLCEWWEAWSAATNPPTSPELVLAGRDEAANALLQWLATDPSCLELQAGTSDEALAVFAATVMSQPAERRDALLSRTLVVDTEDALAQLVLAASPLVLVTLCEDRQRTPTALKNGHCVVIPIGKGELHADGGIEVPRLRRAPAQDALAKMGIPDAKAEKLAAVARRSMAAFRRRLLRAALGPPPDWSRPDSAVDVLPFVLIGSWEDGSDADWAVIQQVAGKPRDLCSQLAIRWASTSDPPLRKVGRTWYASDKYDALQLIGRYVTKDLSMRFEAEAVDVLRVPDPKYDLPPTERYMAKVVGKTLPTSDRLRHSLADTLALLGVLDEDENADTSLRLLRPARIVDAILSQAAHNWQLWATLADLLPLLAEAAPDTLLEHLDRDLKAEEPLLLRLFNTPDIEDGLLVDHAHVGLLWALEDLAWSREYVAAASLALGRLAELDPAPDSNFMMRPANSLRHIFLLWHPQISADAESRLQPLDLLRTRHPEVAWKLMLSVLPRSGSIRLSPYRPIHRDWAPDEDKPATSGDLVMGVRAIGDRLLQDVGISGQRWSNLLDTLNHLTDDVRRAVVERVKTIAATTFAPPDRLVVWEQLCRLVSRHRHFAGADPAPGDDVLDELDAARHRLEPTDIVDRYRLLFSRNPVLPGVSPMKWDEWNKALTEERTRAVEQVLAHVGMPAVVRLARTVETPWTVGYALGVAGLYAGNEPLAYLASETPALDAFARGFAAARWRQCGVQWAADVLAAEMSWPMSAVQRGLLLACTTPGEAVWALVDAEEAAVQEAYWETVDVVSVANGNEMAHAVDHLLSFDRPAAAILLICGALQGDMRKQALASAEAALLRLAGMGPEPNCCACMLAPCVGQLLDALEADKSVEASRLAQFESQSMPLLRQQREPAALGSVLAGDPALFVELVRCAYGLCAESGGENRVDNEARAKNAYQLLGECHVVPGSRPDGSIDAAALRGWVTTALRLAADAYLQERVEYHIGCMLAHSVPNADGLWPPAPVREILEDVRRDGIEEGFEIQAINNRGGVTKRIDEGGRQERELAQQHEQWASAVSLQCPRTARLLRRLAGHYKASAARADDDASLAEDLER